MLFSFHEESTEVVLGGQVIVRPATQHDICNGGSAAASVGVLMVELEPRRLSAAHASRIDVGATAAVALRYGAPKGNGQMTAR